MARAGVTNSPLRCMIMLISDYWFENLQFVPSYSHCMPSHYDRHLTEYHPRQVLIQGHPTRLHYCYSSHPLTPPLSCKAACCVVVWSWSPRFLNVAFPLLTRETEVHWRYQCQGVVGTISQAWSLNTPWKICIKIYFPVSKNVSFNNRTSCTKIIGCHFFAP